MRTDGGKDVLHGQARINLQRLALSRKEVNDGHRARRIRLQAFSNLHKGRQHQRSSHVPTTFDPHCTPQKDALFLLTTASLSSLRWLPAAARPSTRWTMTSSGQSRKSRYLPCSARAAASGETGAVVPPWIPRRLTSLPPHPS
eukprot:scaffold2224_cov261-Pinguiococcus_pyrenoidosus.AAC.55